MHNFRNCLNESLKYIKQVSVDGAKDSKAAFQVEHLILISGRCILSQYKKVDYFCLFVLCLFFPEFGTSPHTHCRRKQFHSKVKKIGEPKLTNI